MEMNAANAAELVAAIHAANATPNERYVIHLTGIDSDYVVDHAEGELFGGTAFPVIVGDVTIEGNGRTITRLNNAPPFRFFAVNSRSGHPGAKLTLSHLNLISGNSDSSGGGAIVNDGELKIDTCVFQNNQGTLGGAIYCGTSQLTTITNSLFTRNIATQQGGAIFMAGDSRTAVKRSMFYENMAPGGGSSVVVNSQREIHFESCSIQDGITVLVVSLVNFHITTAVNPAVFSHIRLSQHPITFTAWEHELHSYAQFRGRSASRPPLWQTDTIASSATETILYTLEEKMEVPYQLIDSLLHNYQTDALIELIKGLEAKIASNVYGSGQFGSALYHIKQQLLSTAGIEMVRLLFDCFIYFSQPDYRHIAASIGAGQSAGTIIEFFNERADEVLEKWRKSGNVKNTSLTLQVDVLTSLTQEMVIRGVQDETILLIRNFLEAKSEIGYSSSDDLLWLPVQQLDIEDRIAQFLYEFRRYFNRLVLASQGHEISDNLLSPNPNSINAQEREIQPHEKRITSAVQVWGKHSVQIFNFENTLSQEDIIPDLLAALKLACLEGASGIKLISITPNQALLELFVPAFSGGAYGGGIGAAYGRLWVWQSVAGLVGAAEHASIGQVVDLAKQTQWFYFYTDSNWFDHVAWDIGIIALRPDRQTLVVLAASDTD